MTSTSTVEDVVHTVAVIFMKKFAEKDGLDLGDREVFNENLTSFSDTLLANRIRHDLHGLTGTQLHSINLLLTMILNAVLA